MLLSGDQIRAGNIVEEANDARFRNASYDLEIGSIVRPDGTPVEEYELPPQGLVKVVSAERVAMPSGLVGYVFVKTSLCNEGILALNIGIVDPLFSGPLVSTLINFGRSRQRLRRGDVFSRLTVHDIREPVQSGDPIVVTRENAIRRAVDEVDRYLSDKFLDLGATSDAAAKKVFEDYKKILFTWIPVAALFVAGLTFALNFGNMWGLYRYFYPQDMVRNSAFQEDWRRELERLKLQNMALELRTRDLESANERLEKAVQRKKK